MAGPFGDIDTAKLAARLVEKVPTQARLAGEIATSISKIITAPSTGPAIKLLIAGPRPTDKLAMTRALGEALLGNSNAVEIYASDPLIGNLTRSPVYLGSMDGIDTERLAAIGATAAGGILVASHESDTSEIMTYCQQAGQQAIETGATPDLAIIGALQRQAIKRSLLRRIPAPILAGFAVMTTDDLPIDAFVAEVVSIATAVAAANGVRIGNVDDLPAIAIQLAQHRPSLLSWPSTQLSKWLSHSLMPGILDQNDAGGSLVHVVASTRPNISIEATSVGDQNDI